MKNVFKKIKKIGISLYSVLLAASVLPCAAFADGTDLKSNSTLQSVFGLLSTGITIAGGALIVWGGVTIGMAVSQHQGDQMTPGILKIIGGAIMVAAAVMFNTILS